MNLADINYVRQHLRNTDILYQLAEEASELSQAALKLARKIEARNPTPKSYDNCVDNLREEIADVKLCIDILGLPDSEHSIQAYKESKLNRWCNRLSSEGESK